MKRLSDLPAEDRLTSRAHALIRAIGPTVESEERFRLVRRSLDTPPRAAPRWSWRLGLAVGVLAAGAAAAVGSSAVSRLLGHEPPQEGPAPQAMPASRPKRPTAVPAPAELPPDRVVDALPSAAPGGALPPAIVPTARAVAPPLSDVARVHEAAKALRQDRNAERALQLLERGAPVTGPLAEEALALRIEASVTSGNGRQAKLASAYLARYPQGRYRELAKKVLTESKP